MPLIGDLVYSLGDRIVEVAKEMVLKRYLLRVDLLSNLIEFIGFQSQTMLVMACNETGDERNAGPQIEGREEYSFARCLTLERVILLSGDSCAHPVREICCHGFVHLVVFGVVHISCHDFRPYLSFKKVVWFL